MEEKIQKLIKDTATAFVCKECKGGGADGQEPCSKCKGTGLVNWDLEYTAQQLLALFKSEMLDIVGEDGEDELVQDLGYHGKITKTSPLNEFKQQLREKIKSLK